MKKLKEILGGIWKIYAALWFVLLLLLFYPLYLIYLKDEKSFHKALNILEFHTNVLLFVSGIIVKIENQHYLKENHNCVITPNHTSYLDILVLYPTIPDYFVFMGKQELQKIPIFNIFFKKMNIAVDRKSAVSGKLAMERCAKELAKGHSIVMFPEGTIPKTTPHLSNFKNGAFKLAIEQQVPIIPITFLSNYRRLEMGGLFSGKAGPGPARVIVHEPIPTKGMTEEDLVPLRNKVHEIIKEELIKHGRYERNS
ncbi:MAG: 1-acyl-sn-glycerol-3-phosphate acyltransferase [Flavobacteriales bacterium]|nr:1-acyl-sn-glycerol-3-phosphate acyltransferase [Flavobacteriales bacterium]